MKETIILLWILAFIQLGLIIYNLDINISIKVLNNLSWWWVFVPVYIVVIIIGFWWFLLSGLNM